MRHPASIALLLTFACAASAATPSPPAPDLNGTPPATLLQILRTGAALPRQNALYALAKSPSPDPAALDTLHSFLTSKVWQERFLALQAIAEADPTFAKVGPWILDLTADPDARVANAAFNRLSTTGTEPITITAIKRQLASTDAAIRIQGCNRIYKIKSPPRELIDRIAALATSDPQPDVRRAATGQLVELRPDAAIAPLLLQAHDPVDEVGRQAITSLIDINPTLPQLTALASDPDLNIHTRYANARNLDDQIKRAQASAAQATATQPAPANPAANFTGTWTFRDAQGRITARADYKNGQFDGHYLTYDPAGNTVSDFVYVQGQPDGRWTTYGADHAVVAESNYFHGIQDGLFISIDNGFTSHFAGTYRFGLPWDGTFGAQFSIGPFPPPISAYENGEPTGDLRAQKDHPPGYDTLTTHRNGTNFHIERIFSKGAEILARKITDDGAETLVDGTVDIYDPANGKWIARTYEQGRPVGSPLAPELKGLLNPKIHPDSLMTVLDDTATDADLTDLAAYPDLRNLRVNSSHLTDAGFAVLEKLPHLQFLELRGVPLTSEGLRHFSHLTELQVLDIGISKVDDIGLTYIQDLTQLRTLQIDRTQITDAGLKSIATFKNLESLQAYHTAVTDAGLDALAPMSHLKLLDLRSTKVTDAASLQQLKSLTHLQHLFLRNLPIHNADLAALADLDGLTYLTLDQAPITDAALPYLLKIKNLHSLYIRDVKLSPASIQSLKAAFPNIDLQQ